MDMCSVVDENGMHWDILISLVHHIKDLNTDFLGLCLFGPRADDFPKKLF